MEKKIKLTPKQKEIVKLMREGKELRIDFGLGYLTRKRKAKVFFQNKPIAKFTWVDLIDAQLIEQNNDKLILTELGKTLPLEPDTSTSRTVTKRNNPK